MTYFPSYATGYQIRKVNKQHYLAFQYRPYSDQAFAEGILYKSDCVANDCATFVDDRDGVSQQVYDGDWIVAQSDNDVMVMSDEAFRWVFEPREGQ